jgi:imidazolonepropionase-like amidohydrolase
MIIVEGGQLLLPDGKRVAGDIAIERDKIIAVGTVSDAPPDAVRIDARGCTVMPGLINMHSHLTLVPDIDKTVKVSRAKIALLAARQGVRALRAGITRVRDIGGYRHVDLDLRNAIDAGLVPGPKMVCAGKFIAITGGHAWPYIREADGEAEVRKAVREQIQAGANFIKLMGSGGVGRADESEGAVQFSFPEVKAIVEEAQAASTVATAHVHPERAISNAVRAGVKSVEHGTHLTPELAKIMVDQGTFLTPTFAVYRGIATDGRWPELAPRAQQVYDTKIKTFKMAVEIGVNWAIGTDAGSFIPESAIADEMEIAQSLGFSATEVLRQATQGNAELWDWSDVGKLEVGLTADVLVVTGDPTTNLSDVRNVQVTIARGTVYDWRRIDALPGPSPLPF